MFSGEAAKNSERAGRLVRIGPLEEQDRTMLGELLDAACQRFDGGRMQLERMIGRIAGDHCRIDASLDRLVDRVAEAAIDFGQCIRRIVQV